MTLFITRLQALFPSQKTGSFTCIAKSIVALVEKCQKRGVEIRERSNHSSAFHLSSYGKNVCEPKFVQHGNPTQKGEQAHLLDAWLWQLDESKQFPQRPNGSGGRTHTHTSDTNFAATPSTNKTTTFRGDHFQKTFCTIVPQSQSILSIVL